MWSCPSITSAWHKPGSSCRKVWISLHNQGTSSPQFSRGCSGREEQEKHCFREAAGRAAHPYCPWHSRTEHHLQLLISRNLCLLNQTDQKFLCFHLFSFLPSCWGQHFIFQCRLCAPLLLAGVWLWAQPGTGSEIPPVPGLRLSWRV